jgi:hypothetical protein
VQLPLPVVGAVNLTTITGEAVLSVVTEPELQEVVAAAMSGGGVVGITRPSRKPMTINEKTLRMNHLLPDM